MTQCKNDPRAPHGFMRNASHNSNEYVCECEHWQSPFDSWYNGLVGFHITSERIISDISGIGDGVDTTSLRKWMVVCWNKALEAALQDEYMDHGSILFIESLMEPLDKLP